VTRRSDPETVPAKRKCQSSPSRTGHADELARSDSRRAGRAEKGAVTAMAVTIPPSRTIPRESAEDQGQSKSCRPILSKAESSCRTRSTATAIPPEGLKAFEKASVAHLAPARASLPLRPELSPCYNMAMTSTVPPIIDQAAWDVGVMAQRLASEYYTHVAALHVAADPRATTFAPPVEPGEMVSVLRVPRDDGTCHKFAFDHFIADVKKPELLEDFKRSWLASSLLRIGDALGEHDYFHHAPEAELVRHLRNGVAHKNRLHFEMKNKKVVDPITGKLRYPAHNRRYTKALTMREYVIDTDLQGDAVLFDYGGPAAILDILTALGWHLTWSARGVLP
jgi:hypothetical protein